MDALTLNRHMCCLPTPYLIQIVKAVTIFTVTYSAGDIMTKRDAKNRYRLNTIIAALTRTSNAQRRKRRKKVILRN